MFVRLLSYSTKRDITAACSFESCHNLFPFLLRVCTTSPALACMRAARLRYQRHPQPFLHMRTHTMDFSSNWHTLREHILLNSRAIPERKRLRALPVRPTSIAAQACVRYVARKHSLLGETLEDCARVEMVAEACRDLRMPGVMFPFSTASEQERVAAISSQIAKTCPGIARMFDSGGADVLLCKSGISYADIMLAEAIHMLLVRVGASPFQAFPRLLALHSHITGMPAIANYLSSPLRLNPDDSIYSREVNYVLGRGGK